jgi:hypothetical protein
MLVGYTRHDHKDAACNSERGLAEERVSSSDEVEARMSVDGSLQEDLFGDNQGSDRGEYRFLNHDLPLLLGYGQAMTAWRVLAGEGARQRHSGNEKTVGRGASEGEGQLPGSNAREARDWGSPDAEPAQRLVTTTTRSKTVGCRP